MEWEQDYELVYITLPYTKGKVNVTSTKKHINIKINDIVVLDGELYDDIYGDETVWYIDSNKLEITLSKVKREDCYGWWIKLLTIDKENRDVPDMRSLSEFSDKSQVKIKQMLSNKSNKSH